MASDLDPEALKARLSRAWAARGFIKAASEHVAAEPRDVGPEMAAFSYCRRVVDDVLATLRALAEETLP